MPTRKGSVDEFLNSGIWHFAHNRQCTRRAVREFLLEMPLNQFARLVRHHEVLVIATARHQVVTAVSYGLERPDGSSGCTHSNRRLHVVHLSPAMEQLRDSEVRATVFGGLTYAFALADGCDEKTAMQLAGRAQICARLEGE